MKLSIEITERHEASLSQIAEKSKCFEPSGRPSWRVLLRNIAEGFVTVTSNTKDSRVFVDYRKPPNWWRGDADNAMPVAIVESRYKVSVDALIEKGFIALDDRLQAPWRGWKPKDAFNPKKREIWWTPIDDSTMLLEDVLSVSGLTPDRLLRGGLTISECGNFLEIPEYWAAWKWKKSDHKQKLNEPREESMPAVVPASTPELDDNEKFFNDLCKTLETTRSSHAPVSPPASELTLPAPNPEPEPTPMPSTHAEPEPLPEEMLADIKAAMDSPEPAPPLDPSDCTTEAFEDMG